MAVCIPNMKMPEGCHVCPFCILQTCYASDPMRAHPFTLDGLENGVRPPNCPLRECPHSVKGDEKDG